MNTKDEILSRLKELLKSEGEAQKMYIELANNVKNEALKSFFIEIAKEEKQHAEIVLDLIKTLEND